MDQTFRGRICLNEDETGSDQHTPQRLQETEAGGKEAQWQWQQCPTLHLLIQQQGGLQPGPAGFLPLVWLGGEGWSPLAH